MIFLTIGLVFDLKMILLIEMNLCWLARLISSAHCRYNFYACWINHSHSVDSSLSSWTVRPHYCIFESNSQQFEDDDFFSQSNCNCFIHIRSLDHSRNSNLFEQIVWTSSMIFWIELRRCWNFFSLIRMTRIKEEYVL